MKLLVTSTFALTLVLTANVFAQFPVRIPKITVPKAEKPKTYDATGTEEESLATGQARPAETSTATKPRSGGQGSYNRQFVMDDGFTFFVAEAVKGRNPRNTGDVDVGWRFSSHLRLMGSFPENSAFRVVVKKDGKEVGKQICKGNIYRKDKDIHLRNGKSIPPMDDFLSAKGICSEPAKPFTTLGWHDVDVYLIDGSTDKEQLARTYKIDVHKFERMRGAKGDEYPGVAEYYVQRYAEASVGIMHAGSGVYRQVAPGAGLYDTFEPNRANNLFVYMPIVPGKRPTSREYLRCSVNDQNIRLTPDGISANWSNGRGEWAQAAHGSRDSVRFNETITFTYITAKLPLSVGKVSNATNVSENPGKWECKIMDNAEVYRIFRFEVGSDGEIVQHPEQKTGNINLLGKTYLIEVEIPAGGSSIDERSIPMPTAGIFYGIPWSTPEGKAASARVPTKGTPYPTLPK